MRRLFCTVALASTLLVGDAAHAKMDPWCGPVSASLFYSDHQGHEALRIEMKAARPPCSLRYPDDVIKYFEQPSLNIQLYGKSIEIPNHCLSGLRFNLSDISVTMNEQSTGAVILVHGVTIADEVKIRAVIHISREVECGQSTE